MKVILIWVALVLTVGTVWGYDPPESLKGEKITPIKGIIVVCGGQSNADECDESYLVQFFNNSHIKILTRQHLKVIFEEKSLQMSGLTEREKSEEFGKILGASHILLFKKINDDYGYSMDYTLINIHSSEIEYSVRSRDLYTKKTKIKFFTTYHFLNILNKHIAK